MAITTRTTRSSRKKAGAPKIPYNKDGNLNHIWVKENGNSHATFIVDPKGTGTYCHITITFAGDRTKYHYGFEIRNPKNRAMGKHFWTTPYIDNYKFTPAIKKELEMLYKELCQSEEVSHSSSIHLTSNSSNKSHKQKKVNTDSRASSRKQLYRTRFKSRTPRHRYSSFKGGFLNKRMFCKYKR